MGLFAQVGGVEEPLVWRVSFVVIATAGALSTLRLLATDADPAVTAIRTAAIAIYVLVASLALFSRLAELVGLRPIQVAALLLVGQVALGHGLVWHYLTHDGHDVDLRG